MSRGKRPARDCKGRADAGKHVPFGAENENKRPPGGRYPCPLLRPLPRLTLTSPLFPYNYQRLLHFFVKKAVFPENLPFPRKVTSSITARIVTMSFFLGAVYFLATAKD